MGCRRYWDFLPTPSTWTPYKLDDSMKVDFARLVLDQQPKYARTLLVDLFSWGHASQLEQAKKWEYFQVALLLLSSEHGQRQTLPRTYYYMMGVLRNDVL